MKKEIVKLENVTKTYAGKQNIVYALKAVNFTLYEGEFIIILGPSGAGKSTVLNLIGGIDEVSEGEIFVNGKSITNLHEEDLASFRAKDIGFVFQFYNLIPTLTAKENVALMRELKKDVLNPADALARVGLQDHLDKFPSQLSGGEQQRVSIARAIAKKPTLLLCDEPTGALDSTTGLLVLNQLKSMCKTYGHTTIIVTHNEALQKAADRVIYVKNGSIDSIVTHETPVAIDEVEY